MGDDRAHRPRRRSRRAAASTASASRSRTIRRRLRRRCSTRSATRATFSAPPSTPAGGRRRDTTPSQAIEELSERLFHVHLKDVEAPGTHVTCMYGDGCARISDCVDELLCNRLLGRGEHRARAVRPRPDRRVRADARDDPTGSSRHRRRRIVSEPLRVAIVGCGNISGAVRRDDQRPPVRSRSSAPPTSIPL